MAVFLCLAISRPASAQVVPSPVRITSPPNHAVFYAPVDIPIFAYVDRLLFFLAAQVNITNVEFYAGTNDLGSGFDLGSTVRRPPVEPAYETFVSAAAVPRLKQSVFCIVWTNAPAGSNVLTAVATDDMGMSRTSPPVNVTILLSTTNTNPVDVVSIVATDPIAVAGTNSWFWPGVTNATPDWTNWPPPSWRYFTNWAPKDALFTVRRFGDAGNPITVNYSIGGTASNGVDYVALPGYATIPAGIDYALIPIIPIDTNTFPKTVILKLDADTNLPPDYVVGIPPCAEALILESWPRPLPFLLPDGSFHVNASGPDGAWFCVETSSNLVDWTCVSTNQAFQGSVDFIDPGAPDYPSRFYNTVPVTNTPGD